MNFFRDYSIQLRDAFLSLPMASRVMAVLLTVLVAIGLGMLLRTGSSGSTEYLFSGRLLDENEIMKAEIAFSTAGLTNYEVSGSRIRVPRSSRDLYLKALGDGDAMPLGEEDMKSKAFDELGPFDSYDQRQARLQHATEQQLARTIMQFKEIKTASVQTDRREGGFRSERKQSASVFVTPVGNDPLPRGIIKKIEEHVSAAFAGMAPEDVQVTDANSSEFDIWGDNDDPVARAKRYYEEEYKKRIARLLNGYGEMQIETEVVINPDLRTAKTVLQYDAEPTTTREATQSYSSEPSVEEQKGVPGVASNAYGNQPTSISSSGKVANKITQSTEQYDRVPGHEVTQTETGGLLPTRVSVSIALPQSYYRRVHLDTFLRANPGSGEADVPQMTADEFEQLRKDTADEIKSLVATLLPPVDAGDDRFPLVSVHDYPDLPGEPTPQISSTALALGWLATHWQTIGAIMLALFALFLVRSFSKWTPASPTVSDFSEGFGLEIPAPPAPEKESAFPGIASKRQMEITGANLKEDLTDMIEQNPDAAANVIRSWIGEAA